jgi:Fic family protein
MGYTERRFWTPSADGFGLPARERRGGHYEAYVPDRLLGRQFQLAGDVAADVAEATIAIGRLDARAAALTNAEALARLLLRAEAVASSRIEGLEVSPQRLLRANVARDEGLVGANKDATASEVLANIDAMDFAIRDSAGEITLERILDVHRRLLAPTRHAKHAGFIRTEQNWIGGNGYNPIGAAYIPPPPELVLELLADLCAFCNDDTLPAVAQAAIAHAQFEMIHPFADGNGRTGRALIYMVLRHRDLAVNATPPVSLILATHSNDYIAMLQRTRIEGDPAAAPAQKAWNEWISFFSNATTRAVADADSFEKRVAELQQEWRTRLAGLRSDAGAVRLLEHLPAMPILTVNGASKLLGRSFSTTNDAIEELVAKRILTPANAGLRNRVFEARELIDSFTGLERQLASPGGDTQISEPARHVPGRPQRVREIGMEL